MLDRFAARLLNPVLQTVAQQLVRRGIGADNITWAGFLTGLLAAGLISRGQFTTGLMVLLLSRLCDGLDGAVARLTRPTDAGGFLDITLDFVFYASIPLAFAVADPVTNALPATVLLAAFVGTGTSFLAFATLAAKRNLTSLDYPDKSFYFLGGLTEATETIGFFAAMCLWPQHFAPLAYLFAGLCGLTLISRIWWGWRQFS